MFSRDVIRHPLEVRIVDVVEVWQRTETMRVVKFTGEALNDFASEGPGDHVKVFFPDPATGILTPPVKTPDGSIQRPQDAVSINRDYTPLRYLAATGTTPATLELEFALHDNPGPATAWALQAQPGDQLALVGPRGSKLVPRDINHVLLIADETALPAVTRWVELLPEAVKIHAIMLAEDDRIDEYFTAPERKRLNIEWLYREDGPGQLIEAVRSAEELIGERSYVWAAGEANELVAVRRFLKYDLQLPREQYSVSGYWRRGITNFDHHAPIDASDPD